MDRDRLGDVEQPPPDLWRIVFWGPGIQLGLAVLLLKTPVGRPFFGGMNALARALMSFTDAGARFVFGSLADLVAAGAIAPRSAVIASYALCGFANFGSLAILLGGIGGLAPSRRPEVALLGVRSIVSGSLATFMTACVAGLLL